MSILTSPTTIVLPIQYLLGRLSRQGSFMPVTLALASLALSFTARAVSPPPDGGYPNFNTAEGAGALFSLTTGADNTAIGFQTLFNNKSGFDNTASGFRALGSNTIGIENTAIGSDALLSNTIGRNNTAIGSDALTSNTTGSFNAACGAAALARNTTGGFNTATGSGALEVNTTGSNNTAYGVLALENNKTGADNTAEGFEALLNTNGSNNIALGSQAGFNLTTGSNNIIIGANVLGNATDANTIRLGKSGTQNKTFIAGIRGVTVASGVGVIVGTSGQLGTVVSSARFKEAIKPMDKASEAILNLKPVTFRYKEELDPDKIPQFGLVAEEVEKVNRDLVVRDQDGKINTVRYDAVNAMLLNEFLKEHRKVEEQEQKLQKQESTIAQQQKDFQDKFTQQQRQIEALTATVQKVRDQVALGKPAPQLVANP